MLPVLKKLGLSDKEIAVYTALLVLGSASVRQIAQEAKVNRGTTYDILKSLMKDGLAGYLNKKTKNFFTAEDPSQLKQLVRKQQIQLKAVERELDDYLPQLQSVHNKGGEKPIVRYFEDKKGIRELLSDVLITMEQQADKVYYVYSSSALRKHYRAAYPDYTKKRIAKKIKVQAIAFGPGGETSGLDERKWLSKKEGSPTYTLIYAGNIAHIALDSSGHMVGVIIENKAMYEAHKVIFEALWKTL